MLKKTISRTVIINREMDCLRLAKGYDTGGFWRIGDLENDVTGPLPNCKRYRVDYTLNPNGKFIVKGDKYISKINTPDRARIACFIKFFGWTGKRFNRIVRVLE